VRRLSALGLTRQGGDSPQSGARLMRNRINVDGSNLTTHRAEQSSRQQTLRSETVLEELKCSREMSSARLRGISSVRAEAPMATTAHNALSTTRGFLGAGILRQVPWRLCRWCLAMVTPILATVHWRPRGRSATRPLANTGTLKGRPAAPQAAE
jgi:hypothetical protein